MLEVRQDLKHGVLIIGRGGSRKHPGDSVTGLLALAYLQCQDHFTPQHWNHSSRLQDLVPWKVPFSAPLFQKSKFHHSSSHRILGNWDVFFFIHIHLNCFGLLKHYICYLVIDLAFCSLRYFRGDVFFWVFSISKLYRFDFEPYYFKALYLYNFEKLALLLWTSGEVIYVQMLKT